MLDYKSFALAVRFMMQLMFVEYSLDKIYLNLHVMKVIIRSKNCRNLLPLCQFRLILLVIYFTHLHQSVNLFCSGILIVVD